MLIQFIVTTLYPCNLSIHFFSEHDKNFDSRKNEYFRRREFSKNADSYEIFLSKKKTVSDIRKFSNGSDSFSLFIGAGQRKRFVVKCYFSPIQCRLPKPKLNEIIAKFC